MGLSQRETGKKTGLSNHLGLIVIVTDRRVELEPGFVYQLACDWLAGSKQTKLM